jgi:hypothetical protein
VGSIIPLKLKLYYDETNRVFILILKKMKKLVIWIFLIIALIVIGIIVFALYSTHDRNPGYTLNLKIPLISEKPGQLQVGFATQKITPDLPDRWTDVDNNAKYEPEKGDTFIDGNKNGRFDAFWLAGFDNKRAANGIHDDIWARAIIWDDSATVVGMVVLDAIGIFNDDVTTVREMVAQRIPEIDHVIISATHCHEVPDLMGNYGESQYSSGVNREYLRMVQGKAADAICEAYRNRHPAVLEYAQIDSVEKDLVDDGRMPIVYDDGIRMMKVTDKANGQMMGLLVNYGNHPETAGSKNLLITSDILHYLRDGIERGIYYDNDEKRHGTGGTVIFMNGAVGGIMSGMWVATYDPWLNKTFRTDDNSFDKVRAQGYRLADKILDKLEKEQWKVIDNPSVSLYAKSFQFKMQNKLFKLAAIMGVFDRGFIGFKYVRSEVDLLTIGPAWFITIPGEVNPEIINGGIETPEGRDFEISAVELPPVRELMRGEINFVIGLANDEVGYIMPKSHWDKKAPYTYNEKEAPYGEINSLGPETGPELHNQIKMIIDDLLTSSRQAKKK